jgi:hypothetical protein
MSTPISNATTLSQSQRLQLQQANQQMQTDPAAAQKLIAEVQKQLTAGGASPYAAGAAISTFERGQGLSDSMLHAIDQQILPRNDGSEPASNAGKRNKAPGTAGEVLQLDPASGTYVLK